LKYEGYACAFVALGVEPKQTGAQPQDGPADAIFRGCPILTMSEGIPSAAALALRGERIFSGRGNAPTLPCDLRFGAAVGDKRTPIVPKPSVPICGKVSAGHRALNRRCSSKKEAMIEVEVKGHDLF
jgi:hypothetical protein